MEQFTRKLNLVYEISFPKQCKLHHRCLTYGKHISNYGQIKLLLKSAMNKFSPDLWWVICMMYYCSSVTNKYSGEKIFHTYVIVVLHIYFWGLWRSCSYFEVKWWFCLYFLTCANLPLLFQKEGSVSLFFKSELRVLKFLWKDQFDLADLPLLLFEFGDFTLVLNRRTFWPIKMNFLK